MMVKIMSWIAFIVFVLDAWWTKHNLENDDLGLFIQSADAGGRRGASRHAADDHDLHRSTSPRQARMPPISCTSV